MVFLRTYVGLMLYLLRNEQLAEPIKGNLLGEAGRREAVSTSLQGKRRGTRRSMRWNGNERRKSGDWREAGRAFLGRYWVRVASSDHTEGTDRGVIGGREI